MASLLLSKAKAMLKNIFQKKCCGRNQDQVQLELAGLEIYLKRCFSYDLPHEVTIVVPRAEIRKRKNKDENIEETEIILNSITIVHSPQRPASKGVAALPGSTEMGRNLKSTNRVITQTSEPCTTSTKVEQG